MMIRLISAYIALIVTFSSVAMAAEIYAGEPFGEALLGLSRSGILISHELSLGAPLERTDVFKLRDGRLVAITSRANEMGQPYSITELRATSSPSDKLSKDLPPLNSVPLPERR